MTHMDDQIAKHIKETILKITRKRIGDQERPSKPNGVAQVVQVLKRGPDYPCDLVLRTWLSTSNNKTGHRS